MEPKIINYKSARSPRECFVFSKLLDVLTTALELAFINKDNEKMTISHDVLQKIDSELTSGIITGFGRLMYFFPEQRNNFVSIVVKLQQDKMSFPNAVQYLELFDRYGLTEKLEWYGKNTIKDVTYKGVIRELSEELEIKSKKIHEYEASQSSAKSTGQYSESEISNIVKRNIQLTSEVENFKKKLAEQSRREHEKIDFLEKTLSQKESQLEDTAFCFENISKLEYESEQLRIELRKQELLIEKLHRKVNMYKEKNKVLREKTLENNAQDAQSVETGSFFKKVSVDVGGVFSLWGFEYNKIISRLNFIIKNKLESVENVVSKFNEIIQCKDPIRILKTLSNHFKVPISTLYDNYKMEESLGGNNS